MQQTQKRDLPMAQSYQKIHFGLMSLLPEYSPPHQHNPVQNYTSEQSLWACSRLDSIPAIGNSVQGTGAE